MLELSKLSKVNLLKGSNAENCGPQNWIPEKMLHTLHALLHILFLYFFSIIDGTEFWRTVAIHHSKFRS